MKTKKVTKFFLTLILVTTLMVSLNSLLKAASPDEVKQQEPRVLKQEVVKLQYAEAEALRKLLVPYFGPETRISADDKTKVLTVSDNPENLEKILAVIRKIDVKPKDMVFTMQLIIASEEDGSTDPELKKDPLITELQKLLRFKSYELLDATLVRAIDRKESYLSFGPNNQFNITLRPEIAEEMAQNHIKLNVRLKQTKMQSTLPDGKRVWSPITPAAYLIDSNLSLKSGDRTVVGISRLTEGADTGNHRGLMLIISGKIVS
ncbi:MAG: secretin N-terminal domain-containing protein [Candidatus Saccharicenans sp.]|uniref:secretin N-terminal domain-containing protein n=1 Tax=Candidatus Saccharicenans sp. TaxID=2819258 RepID=UPI00404A497D